MKIGVLTFQRTINYGAALQCYALYSVLGEMGHDVEVIDYRSDKVERTECLKVEANPVSLIKYLSKAKKRRGFIRFAERIAFSPPCTRNTIASVAGCYDCIVVGSDQVWNLDLTDGDLTYFLDFESDPIRCKTYAASAGRDRFDQDEPYATLLSHFSSLLLREPSLLPEVTRLTKRVGGRPCAVVDPTLLLDEDNWARVAVLPNRVAGKRYVLHYAVSEFEKSQEVARTLARSRNCEIVQITHRRAARMSDAIQMGDASPEEFLGLFRNAEATVVSSFHGTCFSLLFGREFYCTMKNEKKASRVIDLLDALDLKSRIVESSADFSSASQIDYACVLARIESMKRQSLKYLTESLDEGRG